jgi:hypothetical protein
MELLQAALSYAARGWAVVPLAPGTKRPRIRTGTDHAEGASIDPGTLRGWWKRWPDSSVGIVTGRVSGLWVLDVDGPEGEEALEELLREQDDFPAGPIVRTGGGGLQYFFRYPEIGAGERVKCSASELAPKLDVRGDGGLVVAPPSVHKSGNRYAWYVSPDQGLSPAPEWLLARVLAKAPFLAPVRSLLPETVPAGQRNRWLYGRACALRGQGFEEGEILAALEALNGRCDPPLDRAELETIAGSACRHAAGPPAPLVPEGLVGPAVPPEGEGDEDGGPPPSEDPLETAIDWLNRRHFVVPVAGSTAVATVRYDPAMRRRRIDFSTFSDFRNLYNNRLVDVPAGGGRTKKEELGKYWLKHPARREYPNGIAFLPGREASAGTYNLWRGFAIQPRQGDCSLYWAHVSDVICQRDPDVYRFVRKWMAHAVQRPWEVPKSAIVLRGLQGTGKNFFVDPFGALFGQHFLTVYSMEHVSGRFNGHMRDVILLCANEATWGGDRIQDSILKGIVADEFIPVEHKGVDAVLLPNYRRLIALTNHDHPVARDMDDRRFLVLEVSKEHKEDTAYFGALKAQLDAGGLEALLWDLVHEDLSDYKPWKLPASKAGFDIKLRSAPPAVQWWFGCLDAGVTIAPPLDEEDDEDEPRRPRKPREWNPEPDVDPLHRAYLRWCEDHGRRVRDTAIQLSQALRRMVPGLRIVRPRSPSSQSRARKFAVGGLEEARKAFELYSKEGPHIWSDYVPAEEMKAAGSEEAYDAEF